MPTKPTLVLLLATLAAVFVFLTTAAPASAVSTEQVLYNFCSQTNCSDGDWPMEYGRLIFDASGNLYGTAIGGGLNGAGIVFELTPGANGTWIETVLYSFCSASGCLDGNYPTAGLIFDAAGNLYGTTAFGGAPESGCLGQGGGTVFELMPGKHGKWSEKVLHSFDNGKDGANPRGGNLVLDAAGNLYSTAFAGGKNNGGTVFELNRGTHGTWSEKVLYNFCSASACADGEHSDSGVVFDSDGNLYGTTYAGGTYGYGTAFKVAPGSNGRWSENVLHSFNNDGKDGYGLAAGLVFDAAGNLYGATSQGGADYGGTLYEITP